MLNRPSAQAPVRVLAALATLAGAAAVADAGSSSSFRLISARPHPKGAEVTLAVTQQAGGRDQVQLFVSNQPQSDWYTPQGKNIGMHTLPAGECKVVIDYAATGMKPGDTLYLSGKWGEGTNGHCWGLATGQYKRESGTLTLPEPVGAAKPPKAAAAKQRPPLVAAVNVNTATAEQLAALSGLGPAKARALVDYRTSNKITFTSPLQLAGVPGIGNGLAQRLAPQIKFDGQTQLPQAQRNARFSLQRPAFRSGWRPAAPRPFWLRRR